MGKQILLIGGLLLLALIVFSGGYWLTRSNFRLLGTDKVSVVSDVEGYKLELVKSDELQSYFDEWDLWKTEIGEFKTKPTRVVLHYVQSVQTYNQLYREPYEKGVSVPFLSSGYSIKGDGSLHVYIQIQGTQEEIRNSKNTFDILALTMVYQLTHKDGYKDMESYQKMYEDRKDKSNILKII